MIKVKLGLDRLTKQQLIDLARLVVASMGEHATRFPAPNPPLAEITAKADALEAKMDARAALAQELQNMTLEIGELAQVLEAALTKQAGTVDLIASGDPLIIGEAGMQYSESSPSAVGEMPKVENLSASQGDQIGEVDLHWNPVFRGLKSYLIEMSEVDGISGFGQVAVSSRSSVSIKGLVSGKRYYFRVRAVGAAGPGPASEAVTRTAP